MIHVDRLWPVGGVVTHELGARPREWVEPIQIPGWCIALHKVHGSSPKTPLPVALAIVEATLRHVQVWPAQKVQLPGVRIEKGEVVFKSNDQATLLTQANRTDDLR